MNEKDYIPYMRKMIGSKRMISVGLCCLIINENGEVLLEKRSDNGQYCLPGGSIDFDETVTEGVKREVFEETGIELDEVSLFMVLSGKKEQFVYPNGDITDYVDLVFISYLKSQEKPIRLTHDNESSALAFFPLEKIPEKELLRGTNRILNKLRNKEMALEVD